MVGLFFLFSFFEVSKGSKDSQSHRSRVLRDADWVGPYSGHGSLGTKCNRTVFFNFVLVSNCVKNISLGWEKWKMTTRRGEDDVEGSKDFQHLISNERDMLHYLFE